MRSNILHPGADELKYEIRGIVKVAFDALSLGEGVELFGPPADHVVRGPGIVRPGAVVVDQQTERFACPFGPNDGVLEGVQIAALKEAEKDGPVVVMHAAGIEVGILAYNNSYTNGNDDQE